ncbi:hypothetical protein scyTo_0026417, partial [Scyliorhinus torazame]|nr:hypothetical protein [Scyliorhinus torazame]
TLCKDGGDPREGIFESLAEALHPEDIDYGVDDRVDVRQQDQGKRDRSRDFTAWAVKFDAVQDVDGNPAQGETGQDNAEQHCRLDLLMNYLLPPFLGTDANVPLGYPADLLFDLEEYLGVDDEHDEQRQQHAANEIEVDHVAPVDHIVKAAALASDGPSVPPHQRHQPNGHRQRPGRDDRQAGLPGRHPGLVTERLQDGDVAFHGNGKQPKDGSLGQDEQDAEHQDAEGVTAPGQTQVRQQGARDGHGPDQYVRHSQRHQEVIVDGAQLPVPGDGKADKDIPEDSKERR